MVLSDNSYNTSFQALNSPKMDRSRIAKRKAPLNNLQRRVRARRDEPEPEEVLSEESGSEDGHSEQDSEDASDDGEDTEEVWILSQETKFFEIADC